MWEFLYKRRIGKCLIVLFYVAVFAVTITSASMSAFVIKYRRDGVFSGAFLTMDVIKSTSLVVMYLSVGLSMFQLGISVQLIFDKIDKDQAMCRLRLMYVAVTVFMCSFATVSFIYRLNHFHETRAIAESIVVTANLGILIFLRRKLKQFDNTKTNDTISSIYIQFFLFLLSYLIICITDFIFGWFRKDLMGIYAWN